MLKRYFIWNYYLNIHWYTKGSYNLKAFNKLKIYILLHFSKIWTFFLIICSSSLENISVRTRSIWNWYVYFSTDFNGFLNFDFTLLKNSVFATGKEIVSKWIIFFDQMMMMMIKWSNLYSPPTFLSIQLNNEKFVAIRMYF